MCILSILIMTCWTRYCIYRSHEEQIAKSLRQTDAHSHPSHDHCLWCNASTRWSQNNQVEFGTRDYFQRYLTNLYPRGSYFVQLNEVIGPFWGLFVSFRLRTHVWHQMSRCYGSLFSTLYKTIHTSSLTPTDKSRSCRTIPIRRRDFYIWCLVETGLDYS